MLRRGRRSVGPAGSTSSTLQKVSGTITIDPQTALGVRAASLAIPRTRPLFVSPNTGDVHVFIGTGIGTASAASGSLTSCTAATGTGTGCSIPWSTSLAVPGSYVFTVEIDTGTAHTPNYTVLAEGAGSYALVAGTNTLAALSLNGVVTNATFSVAACTPAGAPTNCNGTVVLTAAAGSAIEYTGGLATPTYGNSPTSGNVFDNSGVAGAADVTLTSTAPAVGSVTGTAQAPYSTYTSPTLTIAGVNATGTYSFSVGCAVGASGTFGITVGGGTTPSGDVTSAELATLTGPVVYPASGVVTNPTAPTFTCTAGGISSASGTLPVN
jgi:hypothetical protein